MNSRSLAAFLSSLISELLLLLLLLFPSSNPLTITSSSNSNSYENIFPLIHHFLSSSEIVASLSILRISRKRKRAHQPESDSESTDEDRADELGTGVGRAELGLSRNPDSFKLCFKMTSSTFEWLSGLLEPLLECRDPPGPPLNLSAEIRLGVGLFRLATGSDYPEISRRFGVSESVTRFCVKQLCRVLCTNFRFWLGFPNPVELVSVSTAFEDLTGLPNCCGVIGCTRFKLVRDGNCELSKEKGIEESIAAQIVVDSSSRILSIVAGFRGEKGDFRILKSSSLYKDIEGGSLLNSPPVYVNGVAINQYLVGDGGYPLLPWLMVPFVDPVPGSSEENFNAAQHLMRLSALRTIASLKNWGGLSRPIEGEFKTAVAYIGACSILHNVLLMRDDYSALSDGLGDHSLHEQSSQYYRDTSLEENLIESKASVIRSALATKARQIRSSNYPINPSGSVQLLSI
ncbi:hypothetical protein L1049_015512 [Liquidambar formosana]|uniref:DDE Tnp4 domain-containing protein n=1 Tax=Liquidambar formosana TaxID=63359 RepID=A0AAP0S3S4_LIQFO